jgi:hypothetical protein
MRESVLFQRWKRLEAVSTEFGSKGAEADYFSKLRRLLAKMEPADQKLLLHMGSKSRKRLARIVLAPSLCSVLSLVTHMGRHSEYGSQFLPLKPLRKIRQPDLMLNPNGETRREVIKRNDSSATETLTTPC